MSASFNDDVWLVFGGKTGWIGGLLVKLLKEEGSNARVVVAESRLEDRASIARELDEVKPTIILNAAGITGRPNVDWCEANKQTTQRVNVTGTLTLIDEAWQRRIHVTNFATGCIYEYDAEHPIGGKGFTEEDPPNFAGSYYSATKAVVEKLLRDYDNVLTLRLRMPISDDLHPRSFLTKISRYAKVVNVPNSVSVLHDLLPVSLDMSRRRLKGVYNFTNPGAVSHNTVLSLYRDLVAPAFVWANFSLEEQAAILQAGRSNNTLDVSKLLAHYPDLPCAEEAVRRVMVRMAAAAAAAGGGVGVGVGVGVGGDEAAGSGAEERAAEQASPPQTAL